MWLAGARVWAEWQLTGGFHLWDFAWYRKEYDLYTFYRRADGATKQLTGPQLYAQTAFFRPFLVDMDMLAKPNIVCDANGNDPTNVIQGPFRGA